MAAMIYVSSDDEAFLQQEAEQGGSSRMEVLAQAIATYRAVREMEARQAAQQAKIQAAMDLDELDRWPKLRDPNEL